MEWEIVGGELNSGGYWIDMADSGMTPFVLTIVHPADFDIELGRYINVSAAKEAAETHAGVTA